MVKTFSTLFLAFFNICLFRSRPQDLPQSLELLLVCIIAYTGINFFLGLSTSTVNTAIMASILETFFVGTITLTIMKLNHHFERWLKTLMAITGTGFIISLFVLPVFFIIFILKPGDLLQSLFLFVYLILLIWNIAIMGHILRHALDTTMTLGVIFAIIYIVITSILVGGLVPAVNQ